ncbi:MAG: hypothetical protein KKB50_05480 [Planctomycetes bacterium]|nr:hypothetical protein [Planctomycetota bacterium]
MFRRTMILWGLVGMVCLLGTGSGAADVVRYDGHRVVRVQVGSEAQRDLLMSLTDDVWRDDVVAGEIDARLTPEQFEQFATSGLSYSVMIEDMQPLVEAQRARPIGRGTWDAYMDYDEILAYLDTLVVLRPDLASLFVVGQTIEGRDMVGIRITGPGAGAKPGILYEGGIHAREWITPPVVLYTADQLVRNYDTDPEIHELVDRCEWFLVPVFNVDGYIYTWTDQRMWRKNRRDNPGTSCDGVDLNRNWGAGWGGGGSSGDPCDETYRGTAAFSEPETAAMRDFILAHPNIVTFQDIHSYSQLLMWPYGYKSNLPPDQDLYHYMGTTMVAIIQSIHGKSFTPGPVYSTIYPASGVSIDWTYEAAGIISFTYELRDTGQYGFLLPPDQILPSCEEIFPTLIFQADYLSSAVRIEFPDGLPTYVEPDGDTTLRINITAGAEDVDTDGATLCVRTVSGGAFTPYAIPFVGGDEFLATFPARPCGDDTEYYIVALGTGGGAVSSPGGAPDDFYSAPVGTPDVVFSDDMETNQGWTVGAPDDDATTGIWNRMDPEYTEAQPEDDHTPTGTMCWVTDGRAGSSLGTYDVDGGKTTLFSPVLDLSGALEASISYWRWYDNDKGSSPNADVFVVDISNDGGSNWENVETVGPSGPGTSGGWFYHEFVVADYVTPTANVVVRFIASDEGDGSIVEAAVDDFSAYTFECEGLPGDMNCDGDLNGFDIDPFVLVIGGAPPYSDYYTAYPGCNHMLADCNGDGLLNGFDIDAFIALLD